MLLGIDLREKLSFWDQARKVQYVLYDALEHRHYDGVSVIRDLARLNREGTKTNMPFVFTSLLGSTDSEGNLGGWNQIGDPQFSLSQTPQVFLDNQVLEIKGTLSITWDYVESLFDSHLIESMFKQYIELILNSADESKDCIVQIPRKDRALIDEYNRTDKSMPGTTLTELVITQALETPEKTAVESGNGKISYGELNRLSSKVAGYLKRMKFSRGDAVAIEGKRDIETIVHIIGILKAGCSYIPVDPSYPRERKNYILENSDCRLYMNSEFYASCSLEGEEEYTAEFHQDDLAYTIYTSGSTGFPKGVLITHRAAVNTILDINEKINLNGDDRVLGISSLCFDLSVYDVFGTLSRGATLVLISDQRDVRLLIEAVNSKGITLWNSVPAIMGMLLDSIGRSDNLISEKENRKYIWSPHFFWKIEEDILIIGTRTYPEHMGRLFPKFYYLCQEKVSIPRLIQNLPQFDPGELAGFIDELITEKVLIDSIQPPEELFLAQSELFKLNNRITLNAQNFEKFREQQVNRSLTSRRSEPLLLPFDIPLAPETENRRSVRNFRTFEQVPFQSFGNLLAILKHSGRDPVTYYYGSAGGLYPIDIYVYVKEGRVMGIPGGLYGYLPGENSLVFVNGNTIFSDDVYHSTNRTIFESSAFTLFFLYNSEVSIPKYGGLGYHFASIDTGIMVSMIQQRAVSLGLGTCSIGNIHFDRIRDNFEISSNHILIHTMEGGIGE